MDALVSERQPDSAQLDHLRVETRLVGVDETDPVQELLQHLGPAGQREEQVVVGVRLFEPHLKPTPQFVVEFSRVSFRQPSMVVRHVVRTYQQRPAVWPRSRPRYPQLGPLPFIHPGRMNLFERTVTLLEVCDESR